MQTLPTQGQQLTDLQACEGSAEQLTRPPKRTTADCRDGTQAKRDWKEMETKKDEIRRLSNKCVGLKALLLQHAPGNQVSLDKKR